MIEGDFISGRPFVQARISISVVDDTGRRVLVTRELRLLVDTGSDRTLLNAVDLQRRFGLLVSALPLASARMSGVGAEVEVRTCIGSLALFDESGRWLQFPTQFMIPESLPGQIPLDLNLLGADIWGQGDVHVDRPAGLVSLQFPQPDQP